jgi:hypothetical protein
MEEPNFGIQFHGPMYAGGMSYDADNHAVYFTGATYNNNNNNDDDHQSSTISK